MAQSSDFGDEEDILQKQLPCGLPLVYDTESDGGSWVSPTPGASGPTSRIHPMSINESRNKTNMYQPMSPSFSDPSPSIQINDRSRQSTNTTEPRKCTEPFRIEGDVRRRLMAETKVAFGRVFFNPRHDKKFTNQVKRIIQSDNHDVDVLNITKCMQFATEKFGREFRPAIKRKFLKVSEIREGSVRVAARKLFTNFMDPRRSKSRRCRQMLIAMRKVYQETGEVNWDQVLVKLTSYRKGPERKRVWQTAKEAHEE